MNAIELAEYLEDYSEYERAKDLAAAAMLRRQHNELTLMHEAIVELREALGGVMKLNNGELEFVLAFKVLNETMEIAK